MFGKAPPPPFETLHSIIDEFFTAQGKDPKDATRKDLSEAAAAISKKFVEKGKFVEAGFVALCIISLPRNATSQQMAAWRVAYFAGAQHIFALLELLDHDDEEATPADLKMLDSVHTELEAFADSFRAAHGFGVAEKEKH
jgi:hypothetical protein